MLSKLKPPTAAIGSVFQVIGATLAAVGAGLVYAPAGLITGGTLFILFGYAIERDA